MNNNFLHRDVVSFGLALSTLQILVLRPVVTDVQWFVCPFVGESLPQPPKELTIFSPKRLPNCVL